MTRIERIHADFLTILRTGMTASANKVSRLRNSSTATILATVIIAILIWLPRGLALDRFVTADEHAWLARSGNFYRALANGDFAATFQRHHPGVVVTWAGTLGFLQTYPGYAEDAPRQFGWLTEEIEPFLRAQGTDPVAVLAAGRGYVVLIISLALLLSFLLAVRVIGLWPALAGFVLIALDPFHIGLSRLLHLDGLLSSLMFLSLLAFLHYQQSRRWSSLVLSAIGAGLAWLTRSPGLFLIPFFGLIFIGQYFRFSIFELRVAITGSARLVRHSLIVHPLIWLLIAALIFIVLWPAMWVDPLGSLVQVLSAASTYAAEGHLKPTFFNGAVISGDPGWLFYPISYLWRTTPVTLLGLVFALVGLSIRRGIWAERGARNVALILLLYALLFGLFMNIGAKKFDRYLLPIYPALNLVAGLGLVGMAVTVYSSVGFGRLSPRRSEHPQMRVAQKRPASEEPRSPVIKRIGRKQSGIGPGNGWFNQVRVALSRLLTPNCSFCALWFLCRQFLCSLHSPTTSPITTRY